MVYRPTLNPLNHTSQGSEVVFNIYFLSSLEDMFIDFREREEGREGERGRGRERETDVRNINQLFLIHPQAGINLQPFGVQDNAPTAPTNRATHHGKGSLCYFLN